MMGLSCVPLAVTMILMLPSGHAVGEFKIKSVCLPQTDWQVVKNYEERALQNGLKLKYVTICYAKTNPSNIQFKDIVQLVYSGSSTDIILETLLVDIPKEAQTKKDGRGDEPSRILDSVHISFKASLTNQNDYDVYVQYSQKPCLSRIYEYISTKRETFPFETYEAKCNQNLDFTRGRNVMERSKSFKLKIFG